jgi:2-polyprenyl-6-methoxyphenol hydroxylase-like FAD-dependent oxidoreductase
MIDGLVIGAGPTGLTMAVELARAGMSVRIVDKASDPAKYSQALVVQARTLEQFERYGIASRAVERGRKLTRAKLWSEGTHIASLELESIDSIFPFVLFLPQRETEALLNSYLESFGVRVERQAELVSLSQQGGAVTATLRHADGGVEEVTARWLIGCDGAHSTVRSALHVPFEGHGVGLSFFLGDLDLEGPDVPENELSLHFRCGDVVFMGRLSQRLVRVIVALHSAQNEAGISQLSLQSFQDAIDHAKVKVRARSAEWMTPFRVNDRQAVRYRVGSVFLAGDASHIHSPVGGQGMNTGIQDAANLGWKLAAVARGADESLLDSYETERAEVGRSLLHFTKRGLRVATTVHPVLRAARDIILPLALSSPSVRRAIAGFISETAIEYRTSPIVHDHSGDGTLRAGDRMPDLDIRGSTERSSSGKDWPQNKHLLLSINCGLSGRNGFVEDLGDLQSIRIDTQQLTRRDISLTGSEPKLIFVRPDGYIGFRGAPDRKGELSRYATQVALLPALST